MTTLMDRPRLAATDNRPPAAHRRLPFLRGRPEDPPWARPALLGLLALTALLYLWNLSASGWGNSFYAAAAQAGAHSWKAWLFGSLDAGNAITVDKPPAALWVMGLSARIFGVNSWAVLAPQALMGVASVGLLSTGTSGSSSAGTSGSSSAGTSGSSSTGTSGSSSAGTSGSVAAGSSSTGSPAVGIGGQGADSELTALLKASTTTWSAAISGATSAADLELASGTSVIALGGWNGGDPSPTLAQFQAYVAAGRIHYYIAGAGGGMGGSTTESAQIAAWVAAHFTAKTVGNTTVYDLTQPATT